MTFLEALTSGRPFRHPEFGLDCYWERDVETGTVRGYGGGVVGFEDLTLDELLATSWEIKE